MSDYMQRVVISEGRYCIAELEYQLYKLDGTKATLDYAGSAHVSGNHIAIEVSRTHILDYVIAQTATTESTQRYLGREHARRQQRRREPKNVSRDYWYGWYDEWEVKKRGW